MAEAHDPLLAGQGVADPGFGLVGRADRARARPSPARWPRRAAGPLSAPMAAVIAECRSDSVEHVTRAVNVEALNSCSA